jgi:predicted permease
MWRGKLGCHAGNKQATKFAANFQLSISLINLGIFLSFLLQCLLSQKLEGKISLIENIFQLHFDVGHLILLFQVQTRFEMFYSFLIICCIWHTWSEFFCLKSLDTW